MKKLKKVLSLFLAAALLMSATALAADQRGDVVTNGDGEKAKVHSIVGAEGSGVTFDATASPDYITVTYEHEDLDGQYLILMLSATEQKDQETGQGTGVFDVATPGEGTILFIDQMKAEDKDGDTVPEVTFKVYPEAIKDSVIMIYGVMPDGSKSLKAAIVDAKYVLGDVTRDGKINSADAMLLLQYVAGLATLESDQQQAGNVTGGKIDSADAMLLLQVVAGLATLK